LSFRVNDLLLIDLVFDDNAESKFRPTLFIETNNNNVEIYKIMSQYKTKSDFMKSKYFEIVDFEDAGLYKLSWIDTFKKYRVGVSKFNIRRIGTLSKEDIKRFAEFLEEQNE